MNPIRTLLALLCVAPLGRAAVIVVDAAGGGDFTTLTAAVAASLDGDTILIRQGTYAEAAPVLIQGKSLTLAGEWYAGVVTISPGLVIEDLTPGKDVLLQNLSLTGTPSTASAPATSALTLKHNAAHVRVQTCKLLGGKGSSNYSPAGASAVDITDSLSMALVGSVAQAGDGQGSPDPGKLPGSGGVGLWLLGGQVLLSDTVLRGGNGGGSDIGSWSEGGSGGHGLAHASGTVLIVSSFLQGGSGGSANNGGAGGHGLSMATAGLAWLLGGSSTSGGQGGSSDNGPQGAHGLGIAAPAHNVRDYGGSAHLFDVTSPLREEEGGSLVLQGKPGESVLLFASLELHQLPFIGYDGVLMLSPSALIGPFVLGLPGNQLKSIIGPVLPAGMESLLVHLQPAYVGAGGAMLGTGRVLTLLDAAF
jgi:hypothetical protein